MATNVQSSFRPTSLYRFANPALVMGGLLLSSVASANPAPTYGIGSRETALASAVTADTTSFAATFYNPAGHAFARGLELSVGYFRVDQTLLFNGKDNNADPVKGLVAGVVAPGKLMDIPFAFGLGLHLPDDRLSRVRTLRQEIPRWELYDNRAQILFIAADIAIRPVKWLSIAGGIQFLSSTRGRFGITGTANLPSIYDSQLRHDVDADLTTVRIPIFGARFEPSDRWSIGLSYRGESKLDLSLLADVRGNVDTGISGFTVPVRYVLESKSFDAFHPRQVALGGRFDVTPRVRVNLDLVWTQWSAYQSATSRSSANLDIDLKGLPIAIPPNPKPAIVRDPGFKDQIAPRLGVEVTALKFGSFELPLRGGFAYEKNPVPPQTGPTNFVNSDRYTFASGVGFKLIHPIDELPGDVRLDVHGVYHLLPETTVTKDVAADYVGDYKNRGHQTNVGAVLTVGF